MARIFVVAAVVCCGIVGNAKDDQASPKKPLKILMIGNSFSAPLVEALPEYGADLGIRMDICSLYIGGCTLDLHVRNLKDEKDKSYFVTSSYASCAKGEEPFAKLLVKRGKGRYAALAEMIAADRWDVVTVQQGSHDSWRAETYEPFGTELLEGIRRLAPQAKVYVHETWSYTPWDSRLGKWGISPAEMYEKLHAAYSSFAARHGLEVIPVGTAVQLYRSRLPVCYGEKYNHDDVCGTDCFKKVDGRWQPDGDVFHFNPRGHVLQSFVWLAKVFDADVRNGTHDEPPCLAGEAERTRLMRQVAMDAVQGATWRAVPDKAGNATHWIGAKVAFLGDSITDPRHIGTAYNYWQYLGDWLNLQYTSFGMNGALFSEMTAQLDEAEAKYGDELEAIFLFAGTNDFNGNVPIGEFFTYEEKPTTRDGKWVTLRRRLPVFSRQTFCGSVNLVLDETKRRFPRAQVVLMTPLHRGYACYGNNNIQPPEDYANKCGLFIEDYMRAVKQAGEYWSVPVIDIGGESGLYPLVEAQRDFFCDAKTDQLHPNAAGHYRMAETILRNLSRIPRMELSAQPTRAPLETAEWQSAIDAASSAGGGEVRVPAGKHEIGTLYLKSGVTLRLEKDAVLFGSRRIADYPDVDIEYAEIREPWQGLIVAEGQTNVAIVGEGTIDGNGAAFPRGTRLGRPRGLVFYRCKDVRIEGVTIREPASWTCYLKECDGVFVRKVTVDAHANDNNDGIDIDSKNVLVEDCLFDSDDDGIVLKSDNPDFVVENVEVRNCIARSCCTTLKLGTASHGGFRNINFHDIVCGKASREHLNPETGHGVLSEYRVACWPGATLDPAPISGIAVEGVDGGCLENITFRNVEIKEATVPIFVRGGLRERRLWGDAIELGIPLGTGRCVRNVLIENVKAKQVSYTANSLTGIPGLRLSGVTLRNVEIEVPGAGDSGRDEINKPVPEKADAYPESNMFDARMLPAYGFYIRHADGVVLDNVKVTVRGTEVRPEIVKDDVSEELPPLITNCETRVNSALVGKKAFYYCDDAIWLFRDLSRQRPESLFDNPFLSVLKKAHDLHGLKVQINCFYRLDFFYGVDEFSLADMTDAYKAEWQANKDWLRLGFHSLQEFPDYPFVNADYADMKTAVDKISGEIYRFAGPGVFAKGAVVHWGMVSKDACRALRDCGIVMLCSHCGPRHAYTGDPSVLPYGHAMRLLQNRKPETSLFRRLSEDKAISSSIGGYNVLTYDQARETYGNFKYIYDRETGIGMKELEDLQPLAAGINLYTLEALAEAVKPYLANSFFVWGNHEQYFYKDYLAYQPEYEAKIMATAKLLKENGYEHFFLEELSSGQ